MLGIFTTPIKPTQLYNSGNANVAEHFQIVNDLGSESFFEF